MTSTLPNNQAYLATKIKQSLRSATQRFVKTPERSLEQAYQAVLRIEAIEDEYFNGGTICFESANHSTSVTSFLQADFEKSLNIAKLRLAEFKASCFFLDNRRSSHLAKLRLVDEVLDKYAAKKHTSSALLALPESVNPPVVKAKVKNHYSSTINDLNFETVTDKTGALPRSIGRTVNRIKNDFDPRAEEEVVRKFRSSRAKTTTAVRFAIMLVLVPVLTQQLSKQFVVTPLIHHFRGEQTQVFLNQEMQEDALRELQSFEEGLKFQSMINLAPPLSSEAIEEQVKHKAAEIAQEFQHKSNSAIGNVFADIIAVGSFGLLLLVSRKEIAILKSFMDEIVYGLSDSAKAFIIILFTDIFVGFHSPHGWEVVLEGFASHLGVAANKSMISLFIATVPVILDTIFKYWIFRYMSKISPSAVATLRNMNE